MIILIINHLSFKSSWWGWTPLPLPLPPIHTHTPSLNPRIPANFEKITMYTCFYLSGLASALVWIRCLPGPILSLSRAPGSEFVSTHSSLPPPPPPPPHNHIRLHCRLRLNLSSSSLYDVCDSAMIDISNTRGLLNLLAFFSGLG